MISAFSLSWILQYQLFLYFWYISLLWIKLPQKTVAIFITSSLLRTVGFHKIESYSHFLHFFFNTKTPFSSLMWKSWIPFPAIPKTTKPLLGISALTSYFCFPPLIPRKISSSALKISQGKIYFSLLTNHRI